MIECSLIDLVPELGHLFGSFPLFTFVWPHSSIEVRVASNHSILPSGHISIVPCYGSVLLSLPFGWLSCKYCLHLVTLGFVAIIRHKCFQVFNEVHRMSIFFCIDFKVSIEMFLKNSSKLTRDVQEQSIWFQACLKRCRGGPRGKLMHPLGISLAPTICLSGESVVSIVNSCGSYPKKEGWWHRFWMRLDPILTV